MVRKLLSVMLAFFLSSIFPSDVILAMGSKPGNAPNITGTAGARGLGEEEKEKKEEIKTNIEEEEIVITKAELEEFLKEGGLERWRK